MGRCAQTNTSAVGAMVSEGVAVELAESGKPGSAEYHAEYL